MTAIQPSPRPLSIEDLLAHGRWMRGLARSLVGDDAAADDAVQDAYVAALTSPPPADRPLGAWLVRVIHNAVRLRVRGEGRRRRREHAAEHEAEATAPARADVLLEQVRLQHLLAQLVVALDEPVRAAILLRYSDGLSAAEIARATDTPAGTVRWRLKQGLDTLRDGLARAHGDGEPRGGGGWRLALAPLVAMPRAGETAALATAAQGALAMKTSTLVISTVVAAAMLGGGVLWWRAVAPSASPDNPTSAAAAAAMPASETVATTPAASAAPPAGARPGPAQVPALAERRAQHAALAARLAAARARREARAAEDPAPAATAGAAPPILPRELDPLDREYVRDAMQAINPLFVECYQHALERVPDLAGTAMIEFTIAGEEDVGGLIASSQIDPTRTTFDDPDFAECVSQSVFALELPAPPEGGGEVVVHYPMLFEVGTDEAPTPP